MQIAFAWAVRDITNRGGPMGKKSSGSTPTQRADWTHAISAGSCLNLRSIIAHTFTPKTLGSGEPSV